MIPWLNIADSGHTTLEKKNMNESGHTFVN